MRTIHFVQLHDGSPLSPLRQRCIQSVKDVMTSCDTYRMVSLPAGLDKMTLLRESDRVRMQLAVIDPYLCYVDTDCFMLKPFDLPMDESPYFGKYSFNECGNSHPDPFLFFVNGQCDWFKKNFLFDDSRGKVYGWTGEHFRNLVGCKYVPDEFYLHFYGTMSEVVATKSQDPLTEYDEMELTYHRQSIRQSAMFIKAMDELRKLKTKAG